MPVFKDEARGTWYVMVRYQDWTGERKQKCKRGFATKREAQEWERSFQMQTSGDLDMTFEAFTELYTKDMKPRLKENTWLTKENIIQKKILPYFGKRKISEITTKDVIAWQNELLAYRDEKRKPYSATYLKTLHNQLSAIFNHAVRFYELRSNPAAKAGNMGSEERKEMLFWTKAEYQKFADDEISKGRLTSYQVAFSREENHHYVMDLIQKDAGFFSNHLADKGIIMICGSLAMQRDVEKVLAEICGTKKLNDCRDQILTDCY